MYDMTQETLRLLLFGLTFCFTDSFTPASAPAGKVRSPRKRCSAPSSAACTEGDRAVNATSAAVAISFFMKGLTFDCNAAGIGRTPNVTDRARFASGQGLPISFAPPTYFRGAAYDGRTR